MSAFTNKQLLVIGGLALFAGYMVKRKGEQIINSVNPASDENIVYNGVFDQGESVEFRQRADKIFSFLTRVNPFASKEAKEDAERLMGTYQSAAPTASQLSSSSDPVIAFRESL